MTPEQRKLARHALGLPNDLRRSYRNRYFTSEATTPWHGWMALVKDGLAEFEKTPPGMKRMDFFWLTEAGAREALEPGETLDPEDFPAAPSPATHEAQNAQRAA